MKIITTITINLPVAGVLFRLGLVAQPNDGLPAPVPGQGRAVECLSRKRRPFTAQVQAWDTRCFAFSKQLLPEQRS